MNSMNNVTGIWVGMNNGRNIVRSNQEMFHVTLVIVLTSSRIHLKSYTHN